MISVIERFLPDLPRPARLGGVLVSGKPPRVIGGDFRKAVEPAARHSNGTLKLHLQPLEAHRISLRRFSRRDAVSPGRASTTARFFLRRSLVGRARDIAASKSRPWYDQRPWTRRERWTWQRHQSARAITKASKFDNRAFIEPSGGAHFFGTV